jgi:DNA polymerase III subunit delta
MTFESIMSDLKAAKYKPVYFLMGEEPYFIDLVTDYLAEHALTPEERSFNQLVLYGRDTDMKMIVSSARRYPMMASRQVIIVREAQQLKSLEGLESYMSALMPSTVLVFAYKYKKLDKRTKLAKLLSENSVLMDSEKVREDKVPAWIMSYLKERDCRTDLKTATLLVDFLGNDLGKIGNELDKLMLVMPPGSREITADLIEKNIGISKDYNTFELTRALATGDLVKSGRIVRYFATNPKNNPFILTLASLFYYFTKVLLCHGLTDKSRENIARELGINPFFAGEYMQAANRFPIDKTRMIISWLREYDLKSKGGSMASEGDLLRELIFKITH